MRLPDGWCSGSRRSGDDDSLWPDCISPPAPAPAAAAADVPMPTAANLASLKRSWAMLEYTSPPVPVPPATSMDVRLAMRALSAKFSSRSVGSASASLATLPRKLVMNCSASEGGRHSGFVNVKWMSDISVLPPSACVYMLPLGGDGGGRGDESLSGGG